MITGMANGCIMFILWILYHSIMNIGQTWYSFGWESQVLESGFIAIFLVPLLKLKSIDSTSEPPFIPILLYRLLIVKIMFGAVRTTYYFKLFTLEKK
jgi:lipase maturation factor 1